MHKEKTLICHDGALGDVILSLPCLGLIKDSATLIHFTGRIDVGRLLVDAGMAQEVSSADGAFSASLYTESPEEPAVSFLRSFSRAFVFTVKRDSGLVSNIRQCIPEVRIVSTIPDEGERVHVSRYRIRQLGMDECMQVNLPVPGRAREKALHILRERGYGRGQRILAIHPGSGGKKKCWPLKNYLELIISIRELRDAFVVLITGPAEDGRLKDEIAVFSSKQKNIMHMDGEDLTTVAALLSMSDLYIGNDSGISHLAAAVNTQVIVLFGPTDPVLWRPQGEHVHVMASGDFPSPLDEITVNYVFLKTLDVLNVLR